MSTDKTILLQETGIAKPFLKWAGGKGQLIAAIEAALPANFSRQKNVAYIEPFIGSGAVLFWLLQRYPFIQQAVINDINTDLTIAYATIKEDPFALIDGLQVMQDSYYRLADEKKRKTFYLEKREEFNTRTLSNIGNTVLLIFLNKTCFNGLYRVNSNNEFNVPFGRHNKPKICDAATIIADSRILQQVTILNGDFRDTLNYAAPNSFFYFDPPYKPLSKTSSFTSYSTSSFDDREQLRLKEFCDELTARGHKWLLSNSDPGNGFFEDLYTGDAVVIDKVKARRAINSVGSGRGEIAELLISNYSKQPQ